MVAFALFQLATTSRNISVDLKKNWQQQQQLQQPNTFLFLGAKFCVPVGLNRFIAMCVYAWFGLTLGTRFSSSTMLEPHVPFAHYRWLARSPYHSMCL